MTSGPNVTRDAALAMALENEIVAHRLGHIASSLGRHASASVDEALSAQAALLTARDVGEATRIWLRWLRGSVEATSSEMTRLAELAWTLPTGVAPLSGCKGDRATRDETGGFEAPATMTPR